MTEGVDAVMDKLSPVCTIISVPLTTVDALCTWHGCLHFRIDLHLTTPRWTDLATLRLLILLSPPLFGENSCQCFLLQDIEAVTRRFGPIP